MKKVIFLMYIAIIMMILPGCNKQKDDNKDFLEKEFEIENQIMERSQLSVEEALNGLWIEENETVIRFNEPYFMQGEDFKHVFRYEIKETEENELYLTLYGVEGFMVKDRNLFNLHVIIDKSRTQMIMQKNIGGSLFVYHMVYLDTDGVKLSYFDTPFFRDSQ